MNIQELIAWAKDVGISKILESNQSCKVRLLAEQADKLYRDNIYMHAVLKRIANEYIDPDDCDAEFATSGLDDKDEFLGFTINNLKGEAADAIENVKQETSQ